METVWENDLCFHDFKDTLGIEVVYGHNSKHDFSRHSHRSLGIGIVESGIRCFYCRDQEYKIVPGEIFIIPPREAHACDIEGEHCTYLLFMISDEVLNLIWPKRHVDNYYFDSLQLRHLQYFKQLRELYDVVLSEETHFVKQSSLISVIGSIIAACMQIDPEPKRCPKQYEVMQVLKTFIDKHYEAKISLDMLAEKAAISPYHLIRLFTEINGVPPHIYQKQARIRQAKKLLLQKMSAADVAAQCGFTDQSHFSKVFKEMVGVTPGIYINSVK